MRVKRYGKGIPTPKKPSVFQGAVLLMLWVVFVVSSSLSQLEGVYFK